MKILIASTVYFTLVFGSDYVFVSLCTLWYDTRDYSRPVLLQAAFVLLVMILAARCVTRHFSYDLEPFPSLSVGLIALSLLFLCEAILVILTGHPSGVPSGTSLDSMGGLVNILMLFAYFFMPSILAPDLCATSGQRDREGRT